MKCVAAITFASVAFVSHALAVLRPVFSSESRSAIQQRDDHGPAQTYSGRLNGGQFFCAGTPVQTPIISGVWTVSVDPNTPAQVTLNVFYDGRHHLAFGYKALMLVSYSGGVYIFAGFGDSGGGCPPSHPYDSLTFLGVANGRCSGSSLGKSSLTILAKPDGVGAASQPWILAGEGFSLLMHITSPQVLEILKRNAVLVV